ncbi:oxidoreductase-like domain-containing protein [Solimonas marina]|uniref:Oxidoreductase n=1 Tax=Solimonas marina TaxID=2714601 RepID=A0A969WBR6_9GAMM|nr:oxidoreductase-like domain-containing protein [Solimonas marina]NKF21945.1 oxidoreductase [Solimonas marina]
MSPEPPLPNEDDEELPPPPDRPDCCAGGCAQCVLDDYTEEMQRWRAKVDEIERRRAERRQTGGQTPS